MSDSAHHSNRDTVDLSPVRFWWLKRIGIALVLLLIVLGVHVWRWGVSADRKLQAEIDRCRAAGEPMCPADFKPPSVPKEENAAIVYEDATTAMGDLTAAQTKTLQSLGRELPMVDARPDEISEIVEATAKARALIRKARSMPKIDWGIPITAQITPAMLPSMSPQRQFARALSVAAFYQHQSGNDPEAVETILDMLSLARHVDDMPLAIPHLVAGSIGFQACRGVTRIAPKLITVGPRASTTHSANRPVSRAQIETLIGELLDESGLTRGMVRALQSDRMMYLNWGLSAANGDGLSDVMAMPSRPRILERLLSYPLKPMIIEDCAWMMVELGRWIEGVKLPIWPAYVAEVGPGLATATGFTRSSRPISRWFLPGMAKSVVLHYRALVGRRMAAIALAVRLYELDHGHRPKTLDGLVPAYIKAVPLDPFASGGGKIGYKPNADPPVMYSVNLDGVHDGGRQMKHHSDAKDIAFPLNGDWPRQASTTTSQPENDDAE